jgi:hypothetical protein
MFIVAEAGVFCVCEHRQICSIRSMRDASVGIPWMGSGAAGKAAFMLVREVSVVVVMVSGPGGGIIRRELLRDLKKRYS